jgi:ribonucleoside-diphosphate reductase beta chain
MNFSRFNKLKGVGQIVAFSVKDESLHSEAGCWLFRQFMQEYPQLWDNELRKDIYDAARAAVKLEDAFIDKVFEQGDIPGIEAADLKQFIRHRANTKLGDLGLVSNWKHVRKDALERMSWFDYMTAGTEHADFFAGRVTSYSRGVVDFNDIW